MYVHSGTSHGASSNDAKELVKGYPQKTIYQSLTESGKLSDWERPYYEDFNFVSRLIQSTEFIPGVTPLTGERC